MVLTEDLKRTILEYVVQNQKTPGIKSDASEKFNVTYRQVQYLCRHIKTKPKAKGNQLEFDKTVDLYLKGKTTTQISKILRTPKSTIRTRIVKYKSTLEEDVKTVCPNIQLHPAILGLNISGGHNVTY